MCTVLGGTGGDSLFYTQITYPKMPRTGSNRESTKYSNVPSTSGHETAYQVVNENTLNLLIALKHLEKNFYQEYERLEACAPDNDYESIYEDFYKSYSDMMEALKELLSETHGLHIISEVLDVMFPGMFNGESINR